MAKYILMLGVLITGNEAKLFAQKITELQADRPDQTETPFTVPKNHFQMENGFLFEHTNNSAQFFTGPSSLLKYGINDHFEVGAITEFTTTSTGKNLYGLNPVTFRFKEKIFDEKGILPTTSFLGYLTVPNFASTALTVKYFAPAFRFTMQHTLSEKISLGYNLGAEWDGESAEPDFIYTLTMGYSVSEKTGVYAEVYGFAAQFSKADHRVDGGINYLLKPNLLLDFSGGIGLTQNAPDYYLAFGISFRLKD